MDYEAAKLLLFKHVNILTGIRKARDAQTSPFVALNESSEHNGGLLVYSGYLKAIDPISKSVILCLTDGATITNNILIMGHCVCDIRASQQSDATIDAHTIERVIDQDCRAQLATHPYFHRPNGSANLTQEQLEALQADIVARFTKYLVPAEVNQHTQEIVVAESVRIRPPYEHESDYVSPTRVALERIKYIVDTRPR